MKVKCDHRSKFSNLAIGRRSLKKIKASTGFEPVTFDSLCYPLVNVSKLQCTCTCNIRCIFLLLFQFWIGGVIALGEYVYINTTTMKNLDLFTGWCSLAMKSLSES